MYILFEQRERGRDGSAFVESAWERFYRDLDSVLSPVASPPLMEDAGEATEPDAHGGPEDVDYDAADEPGAA